MKNITIFIKIGFVLGFISCLWAEGQKGSSNFDPVTKMHSLVIPITFPDAPQAYTYPTREYLDSVIFKGKIKQFFTDMSYGKFTYTGTVLDPVVAPNPEYKNGVYQFTRFGIDSEIGDLQIPGFDTTGYDMVVLLVISEAKNIGAWAGSADFTVNGKEYHQKAMLMSPQLAWNSFTRGHPYAILKGNTWNLQEEGVINNGVTAFESTYMHELGHALGIATHALSKTNSFKFDYEAETNNNSGYLNANYGNFFSIMGKSTYAMEMNMAYRTILGWVNDGEIDIIKEYGKQTVRIYPMNNTTQTRGVDIRIPYQYSFLPELYRNKGFSLEVREVTFWDSMLVHSELSENTKGIMINRHDGFSSHLLDMSPSANFIFNDGRIVYDIRDVVLKPGMSYSDGDVKFDNVISHADGSFSVDIDVIHKNTLDPVQDLQISNIGFSDYTATWTKPSSSIEKLVLQRYQYGSWKGEVLLDAQSEQATLAWAAYYYSEEVRFKYTKGKLSSPYVYWSKEKGVHYTSIFDKTEISSSSLLSSSSELVSSSLSSSSSEPQISSLSLSSSELSSSSLLSSSSSIEKSSSSVISGIDCSTYPAWEARPYNWVASKEYVVFSHKLYSHTNWVNHEAPNVNQAWLLEESCAQGQSNSSSITSSALVSSSSLELSSSKMISSRTISSSSVLSSGQNSSSSTLSSNSCDGIANWKEVTSWVAFSTGDSFSDGNVKAACNAHPAHCFTSFANFQYWSNIESCKGPSVSSSLQISSALEMSSASLSSSSLINSSSSQTQNNCGYPDWAPTFSYTNLNSDSKEYIYGHSYGAQIFHRGNIWGSWWSPIGQEPGVSSNWNKIQSCDFTGKSVLRSFSKTNITFTTIRVRNIKLISIDGSVLQDLQITEGEHQWKSPLELGTYYLVIKEQEKITTHYLQIEE